MIQLNRVSASTLFSFMFFSFLSFFPTYVQAVVHAQPQALIPGPAQDVVAVELHLRAQHVRIVTESTSNQKVP